MLHRKFVREAEWTATKQNLQSLTATIADATRFVREIERGNLEVSLKESENSSELASSLISMRDQMKQFSIAEQERNWVNEGLAKFVEILRSRDNDTLKRLSDSILHSLVTYLKANQGALFLVNDDDPKNAFLEMTSCYAYDRRKFLEKRINLGEGLAGQVVLEKATLYMTDIPKDYVKITSGLGEALPRNLLVVPLKLEEQVFGVLEIASFHAIKPYQIEFVEKLGESIASTISSVRGADRTKILLRETQTQAEQMRSQEEEMRQSMEELSATQEEMRRVMNEVEANEFYVKSLLNVASDSIYTIDKSFKLVTWNKAMAQSMERFGLRFEKGMDTLDWFSVEERKTQTRYYDRVLAGESFEFTLPTAINGVTYHFLSVYSPLRDKQGQVIEAAIFSKDVTAMVNAQQKAEQLLLEAQNQAEELKSQEEELRQNMEELSATQDEMQRILTEVQLQERFMKGILDSSSDMIVTIDRHYKVINCNKALADNYKRLGMTVEKGFDIVNLLKPEERKRHMDVYARAFQGESVSLHEQYVFEDMEMFIVFTFTPVRNESGEIISLAIFAKDVTDITKAKNRIEESEKYIKDLLDVSSDPIMTIDREYKLVLFNKLYQESFAKRGINIQKGFDVLSLFAREQKQEKIRTFDRVFKGETIEVTEHLSQGGLDNYYHTKHSPIVDKAGNIHTIAIFAKDITDITKANLASQQQNEELKAQEEELRQNMEELATTQEEIHRVLQEVQRNEAFVTGLINASGDSILTLDTALCILNFNEAFQATYRDYNITIEKGLAIRTLAATDEAADRYEASYKRALKGESFNLTEHYRFGKTDAYYDVRYVPLRNPEGDVYAIAIFTRDVTDITHAKTRVEDSERSTLELLNVSGESIMTIDHDYKLDRYNKLFSDSFAAMGVTIGKGFDILSLFTASQRLEKIEAYERAFRGEVHEMVDHLNTGGFDNYYLVKHAPLFDKDGQIRSIAIFAKDITEVTKAKAHAEQLLRQSQQQAEELKAQEEELRQNMEELSATQETISRQHEDANRVREELQVREQVLGFTTILSEADGHGTITYVNDKFCEVSQYRREELIGQPHNILRHPDMPKELFKKMWTALKAGREFKGIIKNKRKDGTHYWVDASIVPIKNDEGKIVKYIGARYHIEQDAVAQELYKAQFSREKKVVTQ